jgi:hypothetical protein
MGSNPILAAIYQRKRRARCGAVPRGAGWLLPDFYRAGSSLAADDLI